MASCVQLGKLKRSKSWFKDFAYNPKNDRAGDVRNILLIVATLIAAVTFQSGVNPPGGVWQDTIETNGTLKGHVAGTAIYASREADFYVFLICNTVALSTSVLVIMFLTYNFPFHLEVLVATASMLGTYTSAIFAVTPANYSFKFRYILIAAALPFVLRVLIYMVKSKAKEEQENLCCKCRRENSDDNSCRRCGSEISKIAEDVKV